MKFSFFFLNLFIFTEVNDGLTNSDWLECRLCYCSAISIFIYLRCSILVTRGCGSAFIFLRIRIQLFSIWIQLNKICYKLLASDSRNK